MVRPLVHYREVDHELVIVHETSSDAAVPNGVQGDKEPPSVAANPVQADVDSERTESPLHSCAAEWLIDKVPICIGLRITGSGTEALTKHMMKAALFVLSHPTFSLPQVLETEKFLLIPATRNQDLGVPTAAYVYTSAMRS